MSAQAVISELRSQLAQLKESKAKALNTSYTEIAQLRKALAEAEERNEKTQSYDSADVRNENARLRREMEMNKLSDRAKDEVLEGQLTSLKEQLAALKTPVTPR